MKNCGRSSLLILLLGTVFGSIVLVVNPSPVMATPAIDQVAAPSPLPVATGLPSAVETFRKLPLSFVENQGQMDQRVKFYAKIPRSNVYFTARDLVLHIPPQPGMNASVRQQESRQGVLLRLVPEGMSPKASLVGVDRQEHRVNYFIGNDPGQWRTGLPTFRAVTYREAYPGIDLQFYGSGRALEYDIIVKPGGNPDLVKFRCPGARSLELTPEGDLAIKLPSGGSLLQKKPLIYQEINGVRVKADGRFKILGDANRCRYSFQVASYDRQHPLIIDPVLAFSTFLGGTAEDRGQGIAVDANGNIYVAGFTASSDFPTWPSGTPLRPYVADYDVFVTKIKADATGLLYSTFLGGTGSDRGYAIAVDTAGNAYITGETGSNNFPTAPPAGPLFPYRGSGDAFVAKISSDGTTLVFSTFLGGTVSDYGRGIAVDGQNNIYVTGYTLSANFPTMPGGNPLRGYGGGTDAFVTKINADATGLLYSTFLGGSSTDRGYAIAVDTAGNAYLTGDTSSTNFPIWPDGTPLLPYGGLADAFVTKINADATALVYSTYLGSSLDDAGNGIAVDGDNNVFVTGTTASGSFPVEPAGAPLRPYGGITDAFVTKIKADGSQLLFSTFLGGNLSDFGYAVAVDRVGDAYVAGQTGSANFPTWPDGHPLFPKTGGADAFVTKIKGDGSGLLYSTFMGGSFTDRALGIAVDWGGSAYITGSTNSSNFPQKQPLQAYAGGNNDAFVAKIIDPHDLSWLLLLQD